MESTTIGQITMPTVKRLFVGGCKDGEILEVDSRETRLTAPVYDDIGPVRDDHYRAREFKNEGRDISYVIFVEAELERQGLNRVIERFRKHAVRPDVIELLSAEEK